MREDLDRLERDIDPVKNIDTSDAIDRLLINMLGAIGQFETEMRTEPQINGVKKVKDRGVQFGKRPALTIEQVAELRDKRSQHALISKFMAQYSLSKTTIYRYFG